MKIDAQNFAQMKAWFARMVPEWIPSEHLTPETHPVAVLAAIEAQSLSKARAGLAMAIGDIIEDTDCWSPQRVTATDDLLVSNGLPTLSEMRLRFSRVIARVVKRGTIKNEVEYYAVRNAAELPQEVGAHLWPLLAAYEQTHQR